MMKRIWLMMLTTALLLQACQKEFSFESSSNASLGSLQSEATGDCLPKRVTGTYEAGTALGATHFMQVEVDVVIPGSYTITTDTINGIFFRGTGTFTAAGLTTVKLEGKGTPVNSGISNFTVSYLETSCSMPVTVLPAGGAVPAVFTFDGAPDACMDAEVKGTYTKGVATNSSNYVVIHVNTTTPGTYSISTVLSNGITFSGSGALAFGAGTIQLYASGTPLSASGTTNIPVTSGSTNCSFTVNVQEGGSGPVTGEFTWKFTSGSTTYSGDMEEATLETVSGFSYMILFGDNASNSDMSFSMQFSSTGAISVGDYKSTVAGGKSISVMFTSDGTTTWMAAPTFGNMTAKITEYNTTTKVVAGTFSGTMVTNPGSGSFAVTNGSFRAKLP